MQIEHHPDLSPEKAAHFAFIVDGEVTHTHAVSREIELIVASMSSDPKVVLLSNEDALRVQGGWYYDGKEFTEKQK